MEALSFILKTYKNSGTMMEQRTLDIVLDFHFVFQLLKTQVKAKKPHDWRYTTRDWAFYDNFNMTKHFLVIEMMCLWQIFNGWQAFMTKLCFGHKQPSPCAPPNLCDSSSWRKWSNVSSLTIKRSNPTSQIFCNANIFELCKWTPMEKWPKQKLYIMIRPTTL